MLECTYAIYVLLVMHYANLATLTTRRRREDNIRMDLREIGWKDVGWIHLVQDRGQWWALVNTVMKLRIS
jgi:hypothetical protein